jgi:cytochrome c peroxidase
MFIKAFPGEVDPINTTNLAKAIATYERGVVSGKAPFDKWIEGDESAISEDAKKGFVVFNKKVIFTRKALYLEYKL